MSMKSEFKEQQEEESSSAFSSMEGAVYEGRKSARENRFTNGKVTIFTSDLVEEIMSFFSESEDKTWRLFLNANGSLYPFKEGFFYNVSECLMWLNRCSQLNLIHGEEIISWENLDLK